MPRPDSHDTALHAIYEAALSSEPWEHALEALADHVGGTGAMLVRNALPGAPPGRHSAILCARLREDLVPVYLDRFTWNPWNQAMARRPSPGVMVASHYVDRQAIRRTEFDAVMLAPQGIEEMLCTTHPAMMGGHQMGGFAVTLSRRQAGRTAAAARRLDHLLPHLRRAFELFLRLRGQMAAGMHLAQLLDRLQGGGLLLDGRGRILHANAAAAALLRAADGLATRREDGPRLAAAVPGEERRLQRALAGALEAAAGGRMPQDGSLRLSRRSGAAPLVLLLVPLPPPAMPLWRAEEGRVLVLAGDPQAAPPLPAALLRDVLGLTPAEARVALLVGQGLGLPQAAARLGVAPVTAKTHLLHVYAKLGLASQAGLARLLAGLPLPRNRTEG